jgi:hypothetical protein
MGVLFSVEGLSGVCANAVKLSPSVLWFPVPRDAMNFDTGRRTGLLAPLTHLFGACTRLLAPVTTLLGACAGLLAPLAHLLGACTRLLAPLARL